MKDREWSESSLEGMAALDKGIVRRIERAVERFAETETGNIKRLQGIRPSIACELASGASASPLTAERSSFCAYSIARTRIGKGRQALKAFSADINVVPFVFGDFSRIHNVLDLVIDGDVPPLIALKGNDETSGMEITILSLLGDSME